MDTTESDDYALLELSSATGPVYRRIKKAPLRDARPDEIPLIDISGISSSSLSERQAVADEIHAAATKTGFFYIKNHGLSPSVTDFAHKSSLEFFRQKDEIKQKVDATLTPSLNGWKGYATQRINASESIDIRESFSFRYNPKYDPNVTEDLESIPEEIRQCFVTDESCWDHTSNLPQFKESIIEYWRECLNLARQLVHTFALSLSLPEDYFDAKISHPDGSITINYYPSIPPQSLNTEEQVSIGSHTDFQLFTILWQDNNGGLQVLNRDGEWMKAAPIRGTFVVNIGDYLQRITNDGYISTVHRARNLSGNERISIPFFFGFNLNETCGVLPSCMDEEHPAKYEPISCQDWVMLRVKAMHKVDSD